MTLESIKQRLSEINKEKAEIRSAANESASAEKLAELNAKVDALNAEAKELEMRSVKIKAEGKDYKDIDSEIVERSDEFNSIEYRKQFRNYVERGVIGDVLKRSNASTLQTGVQSVIVPTVITDQLLKVDSLAGSIFARVTKTNYAPGMAVPTSNFKPTLSWVAENGKSDRQGATTGSVIFNAYKGEIRLSLSLESAVRTLEAFEGKLVAKILEACKLGFDKVIVGGTGVGQPKGILTEADYGASSKNSFALNNKNVGDYAEWVKLYAKLPQSKKASAVLHINASDWYGKIFGMKDETGRVVALDTVGFGGNMVPTFMGRPVVLLEDQGLAEFDTIVGSGTKSKTTAFAYFFDDSDYYFNSNLSLTMKAYTDEDTDERIHKATILADGKVVESKSLIVVCRGADVA